MIAALAFLVFVIAGLLKFIGGHGSDVTWLLIVGGLLVSAEVAWGVRRSGWYRRPAA